MSLLDLLMDQVEHEILKPPFGYPGGKSKSVGRIIPHLPDSKVYVEVFGGSAAVLLAKKPTKLDVYNDRHAGVTAFYQCLRDPKKTERLHDWLELTVHSREDWLICRDTWQDCEDPVERAARWYYMTAYSFASLGRSFGCDIKPPNSVSGKIRNNIKRFGAIHQRFKRVVVENKSWEYLLDKYDSTDTVFYLDPPYVDSQHGSYKYTMSHDDHRRLIRAALACKGYVAISGYTNPVYENQDWDQRVEWESVSLLDGCVHDNKIPITKEVLWLKH